MRYRNDYGFSYGSQGLNEWLVTKDYLQVIHLSVVYTRLCLFKAWIYEDVSFHQALEADMKVLKWKHVS